MYVCMDGWMDGRTDVGMYVCRERERVCVGDNVCVQYHMYGYKSTDVRLCACDYVIL